MTDDDKADWTPIVIEGPLPMGVAGALMQLIGAAWPDAVIDTSGKHAPFARKASFVMLVDPRAKPKEVAPDEAAAIAEEAEPGPDGADATFNGFTEEDGRLVMLGAGAEDLCLYLGQRGPAHDDHVAPRARRRPGRHRGHRRPGAAGRDLPARADAHGCDGARAGRRAAGTGITGGEAMTEQTAESDALDFVAARAPKSVARYRLVLCETPDGCSCGAPVTTPRGMHHRDCAIRTPRTSSD